MKTQRFNVFNQIHKALRVLLFETAIQMQRTDMSDSTKAQPVIDNVLLALDLFDAHANHEDLFILHKISHLDPQFIKTFEAEHEHDGMLTNNLRQKTRQYLDSTNSESRIQLGNELYYALNDFISFNLSHMNKEEIQLNAFLWENFTDDEIVAMEIELQQAIEPEKLFVYFIWMVKGMNDVELAQWVVAVKNGAPDAVSQALLAACEKLLDSHRWELLKNNIMDHTM